MAEVQVQPQHSDENIADAINEIITHYPPLTNERHFIDVEVRSGHVTVRGHVRTRITRTYLVSALERMAGIRSLSVDKLYSDDQIRLEVGKVIPAGVTANVNHGTVILAGQLPDEVELKSIITAVGDVAGVRAVHTQFPGV